MQIGCTTTQYLCSEFKIGGKIMSFYDDWCDDEFAGTYAHDEAGYSNDDIWDIFDGEPDAYWNID